MDALEEQRKRLRELRSKHVEEDITAELVDKDEIERRIREKLEKEFEEKLKNAIAELKLNNNVKVEEKISEIPLPNTNVKKVKLSGNHILTLHDDCVCVWDFDTKLIHNVKTYYKLNDAIFDDNILICASESGKVIIFKLEMKLTKNTDFAIKSLKTYNPIASIHKTRNTIIVVCKNGSLIVLAMNLVDELIKPTQLVKATEILHVEFIDDNSFVFSTLSHKTYIYNITDLELKQIHESKLPVLSLSYHSANLFILSLDRTITKLTLSSLLKSEVTCSILAFDLVATSGSSFILSTLDGIQIYNDEKLVSSEKFKFDNPSFIAFANNTLFYPDGVKIVNLKLKNVH
ncbi:hypothetical protein CANINC_000675 [Pichia inconspicua]|uniref:Uncharacterized protein n=1 Tax=Pichia inconspicua TaxID=52247 RepID=A0A4T0X5P0_9ASCO|nr:hypothetical protein CANINC_000675 [[Candida] inconspicua]